MPADYGFVPVARTHLPLLRRWLGEPHVRAWWGEPDEEIALIAADLDSPEVDARLVTARGTPFAYVQDYPAHLWDMPHYADLPAGARAMDTFLGDPAFLGRGHAARYLRHRARDLVAAGAPAVALDPAPGNAAALKAYRAAGFSGQAVRSDETGAPVLVLVFEDTIPLSVQKYPRGSARGQTAPSPPACRKTCP